MTNKQNKFTLKDLDKLNFHDSTVKSIKFGKKNLSSIVFEIDYITNKTLTSEGMYKFTTTNANLEFTGVLNLKIEINFTKFAASDLTIDKIKQNKTKKGLFFNIDLLIGTEHGEISFYADDLSLKLAK